MPTTSKAIYGSTNLTPKLKKKTKPSRHASIVELKPEKEAYYRKLHADAWPAICKLIKRASIRNYSIYIAPIKGKKYLFNYFEYDGNDLKKDLEIFCDNQDQQEWGSECAPCQLPLKNRKKGEWNMEIEELFHLK